MTVATAATEKGMKAERKNLLAGIVLEAAWGILLRLGGYLLLPYRMERPYRSVERQEVIEWRRPTLLGLRIPESALPGRHWLKFIDTGYELSAEIDRTRVVRRTRISTRHMILPASDS